MGNRALLNRINQIEEIEEQIKELESLVEGLKDEIKADMSEKGVDEVEVGDRIIRYKDVPSSRFDSTTFKKAYTELYNQFVKVTTSKRFTINQGVFL